MAERLGIIGHGIVGQAVEYGFDGHHEIHIYDKFKPSESLDNVVQNSDIIFICLPTPMDGAKSSIDLSIISESVEGIADKIAGTEKVIAIKSTVVPGTTRDYASKYTNAKFVFNPEFLTEANYLEDFVNADRHVVGADNDKARLRVGAIYKNRFPEVPLFMTDLTTAEVVKYFANCLLATKVIFANEMADLCEKLGVEYGEAKRMVVADGRIYDSHLDVTSVRGFGGKCLPKDIVAMIGRAKELGVDVSVLEAVWKKNLKIRRIKDWEEIPGAVTGGRRYQQE